MTPRDELDRSQRVSDAEREEAVAALRGHLLAGRLALDEFAERVERAYQARTAGELARTQEQLPDTPEPPPRRRRPARHTFALFAHVVRRGRLTLDGRTLVAGGFADVDFDLREAAIAASETSVTVLAAFANVDVYVPEGVDVDVTGIAVFGHRREWGRDAARADAPLLRVRALGLFGTVDVWRVPHGLGGGYDEIVDAVRERQGRLRPPGRARRRDSASSAPP